MSVYSHDVTPIKDVTPYFKKDPKTGAMRFTGDKLELRIPLKFQSHGVLIVSDVVTTPGIFDMIINDRYQAGMNILTSITIEPSDIGRTTIGGVDYLVLTLQQGDIFMQTTRVLQDPHIVYVLWTEWITNGHVGYWLRYDHLLQLFAHVKEHTGGGIGVSRSVYEGIIAHLSRDPDEISKQYRLTDRTKPYRLVALKSVSQAPSSTIARLNGSYFTTEGITSALRHQVNETKPFEQLLRGISTSAFAEDPTDATL